ncbi:MAG: hypothetical protein OSJ76_04440 [Alphaproteobacteria bacterium]|nr:hypothetical protein [Alphaproteobacteria bacterium]
MKLPIIIATGTLTTAIAYNAYALTCGAQPSCDSLGYKYTGATTDCLNTPIKCPFNSSYFNCVKKSEVVNTILPDYGIKKNLSSNILYTVGSSSVGYHKCIWVQFYSGGRARNAENDFTEWFINSRQVGASATTNDDYIMGFYLLFEGDTFKLKAGMSNGNDRLYYTPCKGY